MSPLAPHQAPSSSLFAVHQLVISQLQVINALQQNHTALVTQICLSLLEHQSDRTEAPVSCVDQLSVFATVCNSVSRAVFSGERVLELWPILFGSVDVSGAFGCCTDFGDSGTIQQPSQASLVKRSNSCRNHSAALSCMCPEASASSDPVERAEPDDPNEAVGDPGRRSHQNYARGWRREESETDTEHEDSHQGTAQRPGVVSCRRRARLREVFGHLMTSSSSPTSAPCPA